MCDEVKPDSPDSDRDSLSYDSDQSHNSTSNKIDRDDYIRNLQLWIYEARMWQNTAAYAPYYLMEHQTYHNVNATLNNRARNNNRALFQQIFPTPQNRRAAPITLNPTEGLEFIIPPVWKRILAEGVDFVILFIAKLVLTLIVLELLDKSDWNAIKETMATNIIELSFDPEITNGLILLEALHRILVCVYEIYWLHGTTEIRFGCATPGKALLGLTVVVATKIKDIEPNNPNSTKVLIYPGRDLGFVIAAGRAFIKNVVLALMFPFCFAMFIFQFNRTGYDIMCNTVVVEYDPDPPKRNWP